MITIEPVNQKNYVEQTINLHTKADDVLLAIPSFMITTAPITSAENEQFYVLFLYLSYFQRVNQTNYQKTAIWNVENLVFQYDLNYNSSKQTSSRGQLKLSDDLIAVFYENIILSSEIINHDPKLIDQQIDSKNNSKKISNMSKYQYKILLPFSAVKKEGINNLNYSFVSTKTNKSGNTKALIHSETNFGSLSFSLNSKPQFVANLVTDIFQEGLYQFIIKNPILFETTIKTINSSQWQNQTSIRISGKPLIIEQFTIQFNNLHTVDLVPFTIKHDLQFDAGLIDEQLKTIMLRYFEKLATFHHQFDLSQAVMLNLNNHEEKSQNQKINTNLIRQNEGTEETITNNLTNYYYLKIPNLINDDLVSKNRSGLMPPLTKPFLQTIDFNFNFKTWFDYQIAFNLISKSSNPIVGDQTSPIRIEQTVNASLPNVKWTKIRTVTLSDEQIKNFYTNHNFQLVDYQNLNVSEQTYETI